MIGPITITTKVTQQPDSTVTEGRSDLPSVPEDLQKQIEAFTRPAPPSQPQTEETTSWKEIRKAFSSCANKTASCAIKTTCGIAEGILFCIAPFRSCMPYDQEPD